MRLPEDFEEQNTGKPVIYMFIGVCVFVVVLFAVMMILNMEPRKTTNEETKSTENSEDTVTQTDETKSDLVSEDLDFWGMYPKDEDINDLDDTKEDKKESDKDDTENNVEVSKIKDVEEIVTEKKEFQSAEEVIYGEMPQRVEEVQESKEESESTKE